MSDTTSTTERIDWGPVIVLRGLYRGIILYKYDCEKHAIERSNMIANRGIPFTRTDYSTNEATAK